MPARARVLTPLLALVSAAALAACSSSSGGAKPTVGQAPPPTPTSSSASTSSAPAAAPTASGKPVAVDPCQVVTEAEASALVGRRLTGKVEEKTGNGGKRCTYGSQTTAVFWVQLAEAADAKAARAEWSREQAEANNLLAKTLPVHLAKPVLTTQSGIGDRALTGTWSTSLAGRTIGMSSIYLLKGPSFLAFGDVQLNHPAASAAALKAQANTSLSRLP